MSESLSGRGIHVLYMYTEDVALETETGDQGRYVYTIITCKYGVHILIVCTTAIISTSLYHDSLHVYMCCMSWLYVAHTNTPHDMQHIC